jgi:hypothetical protein
MKKILSLLTIIALASCGNMGNSKSQTSATDSTKNDNAKAVKTEPVPADWKTYTKSNYSIQYPPAWSLELNDPNVEFTIGSPEDSTTSASGENLNMVKKDMTGMAFSLDQMPDVLAQLKKDVTGFGLISSDKLKDGSGEYQKVVYSGEQQGLDLVFEQRFYILHDNLYVLTLTAMHKEWDKVSPLGDQILNTFAIKN